MGKDGKKEREGSRNKFKQGVISKGNSNGMFVIKALMYDR
jgi:hypothetical protein